MSNTWKTPKGTILYLLDLRGKPYLQVQERMIWFREDHPDWTIKTSIVHTDENGTIAFAEILNDAGRTIATAHKSETKQGFPDHIEKAETGSIGRALAMCGYGTQFCAGEFDEGERLADAPSAVRIPVKTIDQVSKEKGPSLQEALLEDKKNLTAKDAIENLKAKVMPKAVGAKSTSEEAPWPDTDQSGYIIQFGKFKGEAMSQIPLEDLSSYADYLKSSAAKDKKPLIGQAKTFVDTATAYLKQTGHWR